MRRLIVHFEEIVGGTLLLIICLITALQVVSRYVFSAPLAWAEELATILFAWLVFIGSSLALKKKEHFAIEVVVKLFPGTLKKFATVGADLAVLLFCLLLIVYGIKLVSMNWQVLTPMLEISRGWAYLSVPVGGLLMLLRLLEMIGRDASEKTSLIGEPIEEATE